MAHRKYWNRGIDFGAFVRRNREECCIPQQFVPLLWSGSFEQGPVNFANYHQTTDLRNYPIVNERLTGNFGVWAQSSDVVGGIMHLKRNGAIDTNYDIPVTGAGVMPSPFPRVAQGLINRSVGVTYEESSGTGGGSATLAIQSDRKGIIKFHLFDTGSPSRSAADGGSIPFSDLLQYVMPVEVVISEARVRDTTGAIFSSSASETFAVGDLLAVARSIDLSTIEVYRNGVLTALSVPLGAPNANEMTLTLETGANVKDSGLGALVKFTRVGVFNQQTWADDAGILTTANPIRYVTASARTVKNFIVESMGTTNQSVAITLLKNGTIPLSVIVIPANTQGVFVGVPGATDQLSPGDDYSVSFIAAQPAPFISYVATAELF